MQLKDEYAYLQGLDKFMPTPTSKFSEAYLIFLFLLVLQILNPRYISPAVFIHSVYMVCPTLPSAATS